MLLLLSKGKVLTYHWGTGRVILLYPLPCINTGVGGGILKSLCLSVILSACPIVSALYLLNRSSIFSFTNLGMVIYYYEVMCHAEEWVHCLQCQGHS